MKAKAGSEMCEIFFCNKRKERYCCFYCDERENCKNPCLNTPDLCEKHFVQEENDE